MKIIFDTALGRYDPPEAFTLSVKPLTVTIGNLPVTSAVGDYFIVFTNDNVSELTHKLSGNDTITFDNAWLAPGQLLGRVERRIRGKIVKSWEIEPLVILQVGTDLTASPVIAALGHKIEELKNTIAAQWQTHNGQIKAFSELIDTLKAQTTEAISKACAEVLTAALKATDENTADAIERIKAAVDIFNLNKKR